MLIYRLYKLSWTYVGCRKEILLHHRNFTSHHSWAGCGPMIKITITVTIIIIMIAYMTENNQQFTPSAKAFMNSIYSPRGRANNHRTRSSAAIVPFPLPIVGKRRMCYSISLDDNFSRRKEKNTLKKKIKWWLSVRTRYCSISGHRWIKTIVILLTTAGGIGGAQ